MYFGGVVRKIRQLKGSPELGARVAPARHSLSAFVRLWDSDYQGNP